MRDLPSPQDPNRPENLLRHLAAKLSHHELWDAVLIFVPPMGAVIYALAVLFRGGWIGELAAALSGAAIASLGVVAVMLRYRPRMPSISTAARLLDQRSRAQDRFLTLATIKPASCSADFLFRLRQEGNAFGERVELKRDFSYRMKRSGYYSLGASLLAAIIIFIMPAATLTAQRDTVPMRLRELARTMSAIPELRSLGRDLEAVAARLDDPRVTPQEKQELAQQMERQIEQQEKKEKSKEGRDLLGQAANALEGMDQQVASGSQSQKDQQKGGGIQSNVPQKGQGESKESQGGGGQSKGDSTADLTTDRQEGKTASGNPKQSGEDKNLQKGDTKEPDQTSSKPPNQEQSQEKTDKAQSGSKEGAGNQKPSEQPPPEGVSPAERFYRPGEGNQGIAGARYVTVQLPEQIAAEDKGNARTSKDSKASRPRSQVPVSNVPLPAQVPNERGEKQQLPIEYRGIIR